MDDAEKGSKRVRVLARVVVVIVVLALNIVPVVALLSLVESRTATPDIYMADFAYTNNRSGTTFASVRGTVANPSSLTANNVTVIVDLYVKYMTPPLNITIVDLGSIPANSSQSFNVDVLYSAGYASLFDHVEYGLLLESRSDFGADFLAIALPIAILLPTLDIYSAYKLGFFGWIRARKKIVAATIAWGVANASVIIVSYWLYYSSNPGVAFTNIVGYYPLLPTWDWVFVFLLSIVVGAWIADLEAIIYSFVASLFLSLILEVTYGSFFLWFGLGVGGSFSMITPGVTFLSFVQSEIGGVFLTILRMINIVVPLCCLLGVCIGAFIRSYFDPSVDSY